MKVSREIALLRAALMGQLPIVRQQTFAYQAAGAATGLTVTYRVFRSDGSEDTSQGGRAEEIGSTGRYFGELTTNGPGWFVMISDSLGGEAVKRFD